MNISSVPLKLHTFKPDRFWVLCTTPKCHWLHEISTHDGARTKGSSHVAVHPTHRVEVHTVKTEVIRGKENNQD